MGNNCVECESTAVCSASVADCPQPEKAGAVGLVFNDDWFSLNIPLWERYLSPLKGRPNLKALEIGSWEGRSACWLWQNILTGVGCSMTCIDSFKGNPENVMQPHWKDVQETFRANLKFLGMLDKTWIIPGNSRENLRKLRGWAYDIMYIDGSHSTRDVLMDICLSWDLLKRGGIMILDDYEYRMYPDAIPKIAIDSFAEIFKSEIIEVHRGWQIIWRKT